MTNPLLPAPEIGPDTLTMRSYQSEAVEATREALRANQSALVVQATGLGKTVLLAKIARMTVDKGGKVLLIAHRGGLIEQAAKMLERVGLLAGFEQAGMYARAAFDPQVVVATVQTMQRERLATWARDHFRLILVDEAHHATSASYQAILRHFSGAKVVGFTATPDRADKQQLVPDVFAVVAHEMTILDGMTAPAPGPYLSDLLYGKADVDIDLRDLRSNKQDFSPSDLEDRIRPLVDTLANAIVQKCGERPGICFTPQVASATAMASAISSLGVPAAWVSGDDPDRAAKIAGYQSGEYRWLCNADLLTEGFDAPHTAAIALLRPTRSRPLFAQMIGRGTRLSPGKTDCLVLDFNYLTDEHDLVHPVDLFSFPEADKEVAAACRALMAKHPELTLKDAHDKAEVRVKEAKQRREIEIRARKRDIAYRAYQEVKPVPGAKGNPDRSPSEARHRPPSEKMVKYLRWKGHHNAEAYSFGQARKLIGFYESIRDNPNRNP